MKAVLMAGGFGTRIQPLTHSTPKPMLPVMNIPMMENILIKLKNSDIDEVVILLFYKPDVIRNYFKDGNKWGVKIHYVLPDKDYGTAGAVKFAEEYLDTTFMIVSGDLVTDFNFKEIFEYHKKRDSKLTITLTSVENPLQFGVVITDENGKIEKFLEKPSWSEVFSDTINTGIYIIEPEILDYIPKGENFDFAKDLFPKLMQEGIDLLGYYAKGYWRDVGNPDSYREVHDDIFKEKVKFNFPGKKKDFLDGVAYLLDDIELKNVEIIDKVVIGKNVKIGKNVRLHNCVIGDNVEIKSDTKIKNSIIWRDVKIGKDVVLDNVVACNNVIIENGVKAKFGAILAEGVKVGKFASIEKDVTIWPYKEIEPASIVTSNVIWQEKYKNALFENGRIVGKSNVEINCEIACKIAEAYGSQLPIGSKVLVGRDENKNARMIKRAFVGGLLSTGVNVIDLKAIAPSVLRFDVANGDFIGGVYFGKDLIDPASVMITIFDENGLRIHTNNAKNIEKSFFKEQFRLAEFDKIGELYDDDIYKNKSKEKYISKIEEKIDHHIIKSKNFKIAVDLMYGITKDIFPKILAHLKIENLVINAYSNPIKLSNIDALRRESKKNISAIVRSLDFSLGSIIFPHGQRLILVTDKGEVLDKVEALISVLKLLEIDGKSKNKKYKVFLPTWAPDLIDKEFNFVKIDRGKYYNFDAKKLSKYDLIATIDGNFSFTEFSLNRDAIYATLKIAEFLSNHNIKLSQIKKEISNFYYKTFNVPCPQNKKGLMMRKFLSLSKKHSTIDGVKIFESDTDWILMLPDNYHERLNFYIQAKNIKDGEKMYEKYLEIIEDLLNE